jgi:transposase-like protein
MCSAKNGVSALELSRKLDIAYRSAWFMAHRIRYAMERPPIVDKLKGTVEADEIYIGGKAKGKRGRGAANKTPVVAIVERDGEVPSQTMPVVTGKNIGKVLHEQIEKEAELMTDSYPAYKKPGTEFASHETVDHGKDEYVRGNVHTNTIEGYFSQLKRSIDGTYHAVSVKHLHRYLAEFDYRYSNRKIRERTIKTIRQFKGKRLMYKRPTE